MVVRTLEALVGLVAVTLVLTGCPGDDSSSDTANTTLPTTGATTAPTGDDTTAGSGSGASETGTADSGTGMSDTTGAVDCDPPCPDGEVCADGACIPAPQSSDYGPCDACVPGENPVTVTDLEGCFCSPVCDGMMCPTPNEGSANGVCALELMPGAGASQCALLCDLEMMDQCPPGATCQDSGMMGVGICMHPAV